MLWMTATVTAAWQSNQADIPDHVVLLYANFRIICTVHYMQVLRGPPPLTAFLTFMSRQKIYFEVINPHTVGSLTIPRASIKLV